MKAKKAIKPYSINVKENWGGLIRPEDHTAAVGMRLCDNIRREFRGFGDRRTVIGDYNVGFRLQTWLIRKKIWDEIKRNTSFARSIDDKNSWSKRYMIGKDIEVLLQVTCSGEYCYVKAYADKLPSGRVYVVPAEDEHGVSCWETMIEGRAGSFPKIYSESRSEAMNLLLDYIANELDGRGDIQ